MTISLSSIMRFLRGREMVDKELDLQADVLTFLIFISAVHLSFVLIGSILSPVIVVSNLMSASLAVSLQIGFLIALRYIDAIENMALAYHSLTFVFVAVDVASLGASVLGLGFSLFPATLLAGFFTIRSRRKRSILVAVSLLLSTLSILHIWRIGPVIPYHADYDLFGRKLVTNTIFKSSLIVFCVHWYLRGKALKEEQIQAELEEKLHSVKLQEINALIESLFPDLNRPLIDLVDETQLLIEADEAVHQRYFDFMRTNLRQLNDTAQTVTWIYRAYRNEPIAATSSGFLFDQFCLLIKRKFRDLPWEIDAVRSPKNFECEGAIPSVMLLILSIADAILQKTKTTDIARLGCELLTDHRVITWRLTYPEQDGNDVSDLWKGREDEAGVETVSQLSLRTELVRDLIRLSDASVRESLEGSRRVVSVVGPWLVGVKPQEEVVLSDPLP